MKRATSLLLIFTILCFNLNARTAPRSGTPQRKGSAAAYSTFDSTALSMMIWGTGLAIVIATAAILIPNSTSDSNNNGGNGHAH